jgi:hypothetical protein
MQLTEFQSAQPTTQFPTKECRMIRGAYLTGIDAALSAQAPTLKHHTAAIFRGAPVTIRLATADGYVDDARFPVAIPADFAWAIRLVLQSMATQLGGETLFNGFRLDRLIDAWNRHTTQFGNHN